MSAQELSAQVLSAQELSAQALSAQELSAQALGPPPSEANDPTWAAGALQPEAGTPQPEAPADSDPSYLACWRRGDLRGVIAALALELEDGSASPPEPPPDELPGGEQLPFLLPRAHAYLYELLESALTALLGWFGPDARVYLFRAGVHRARGRHANCLADTQRACISDPDVLRALRTIEPLTESDIVYLDDERGTATPRAFLEALRAREADRAAAGLKTQCQRLEERAAPGAETAPRGARRPRVAAHAFAHCPQSRAPRTPINSTVD
ncbi:hypothetical protein T492DRAFT_850196 [Pavlovales sp. CCMP2436]|nr:hypothetical protein T492DRAFT_850196 [Pavlovales sp. CCMP2436]